MRQIKILERFANIGIVLLLLFITTKLIFDIYDMSPEKALDRFSRIINSGNADDLTLRIYYSRPKGAFLGEGADEIFGREEIEIVVGGNELKEYVDVLGQLNRDCLISTEYKTELPDLKLYYIFETKKGRKLLEINLMGHAGHIFVNGVEYKSHYAFYEAIIPFLPERIAAKVRPITKSDIY